MTVNSVAMAVPESLIPTVVAQKSKLVLKCDVVLFDLLLLLLAQFGLFQTAVDELDKLLFIPTCSAWYDRPWTDDFVDFGQDHQESLLSCWVKVDVDDALRSHDMDRPPELLRKQIDVDCLVLRQFDGFAVRVHLWNARAKSSPNVRRE